MKQWKEQQESMRPGILSFTEVSELNRTVKDAMNCLKMSRAVAPLHCGVEFLESWKLKKLTMIPKRGKVASFTMFRGTTVVEKSGVEAADMHHVGN